MLRLVVLVALGAAVMAFDDYYQLLAIDYGATPHEVKKGFHKVSLRHHPDKTGGGGEMFIRVVEGLLFSIHTNLCSLRDLVGSYQKRPLR